METIKESFESRNIEFEYFESRDELIKAIRIEFEKYDTIGIGNSRTLKELEISKLATSMEKQYMIKHWQKQKKTLRK